MSSSVLLLEFPDIPQIPELFRGNYITMVRLAYTGTAEEGARLAKPLLDLGSQLLDTLGELPYTEVGSIYNDPTEPAPAYDSNVALHTLDAAAVDTILSVAGPGTGSPLIIELRQLGGAYTRQPTIPNAVGARDAEFSLFAAGILAPGQEAAMRQAHLQLHEKMRPWSTGGTIHNFCGVIDAEPERVKLSFTPSDYARLAKAKAAYDPENLFRINHNIPPAL
jgi:hypothetical protein